MPAKRPSAQTLALIGLGAILPAGLITKMALDAGTMSFALQLAAFFLSAGGMMLMFHRWRRHSDTRARALVLAAFAVWALSVGVASVTDSGVSLGGPGSWLAGLALLIGFGGGAITLWSMYRNRPKNDDLLPPAA
ncbi:hypothetical protein [Actinomadura luteofluorescens]|uniref:hypothetical protein n=1 Tax=Actinomadura luteofluorescens TaxID=46163 RepID=UPI003D91DE6A